MTTISHARGDRPLLFAVKFIWSTLSEAPCVKLMSVELVYKRQPIANSQPYWPKSDLAPITCFIAFFMRYFLMGPMREEKVCQTLKPSAA